MTGNLYLNLLNIILTLTILYSPIAYASSDDTIKASYANKNIIASPDGITFAVISVSIPDGSYIYANPKGPGTGRAAEIRIETNSHLKAWDIRYPPGKIYTPPGEKEYVNIYKQTVRFPLMFQISSGTPEGKVILKADFKLLMCNSAKCIPVNFSMDIPVNIKTTLSAEYKIISDGLKEFLTINPSNETKNYKENLLQSNSTSSADIPEFHSDITFKPVYPGRNISGLIEAIFLGLLAGFLLNFMPCVLPVVSLKVMSFIESRKSQRVESISYSAGILASFILLASLAAFSGYRWGEFFQNRIFLLFMSAFIFTMSLSMLGLFTINTPLLFGRIASKKYGTYTDSFIKGTITTLLATPCSGPFLGGILAWSLTHPPHIIFIIFLSIGTGMALPYLILALRPGLLRFMPRPGNWMITLKVFFGFILMFTVIYLISILDNTDRMRIITFLLFLASGLWLYGRYGSIESEKRHKKLSRIVFIFILLAGFYLSFYYLFNEGSFKINKNEYSENRIFKNRASGIISVIEFTADWCPNCRLVEKLALRNKRVLALFAEKRIDFLVADITSKNTQAENLMQKLGTGSIPFLAVLPSGEGFIHPVCIRDIYTADDLIEAVRLAVKSD